MPSINNKSDFITPKVFPIKHAKHTSSKDNIISKDINKLTRNITSSLKVTITDTTANASDSIKHKKNHTTQFVQPFSYLDPPKIPPSTRNIKRKSTQLQSPPLTSSITIKPLISNKDDMINVNTLFKMKNYQTNLLKYSMTKSRITRHNDTKPKLNKIIYAEMIPNFMDKRVSVKMSKNKTLEREAKEAKIKMRFWKGVCDSSYPKILIKKINYWEKYSNRTIQCFHNTNSTNHKSSREMKNNKKAVYMNKIKEDSKNSKEQIGLCQKTYMISSFEKSRNNLSSNLNLPFYLGNPILNNKPKGRRSMNYHHNEEKGCV